MPNRSYSVRDAVNEHEGHAALAAVTRGYGGVVRFAREHGLSREYVHGMLDGNRRVSVEAARWLGFELRWVRKQVKK